MYIDMVCVLSAVLQAKAEGEGLSVDSVVWNSFLEPALRWVTVCGGDTLFALLIRGLKIFLFQPTN